MNNIKFCENKTKSNTNPTMFNVNSKLSLKGEYSSTSQV